MSTAIDYQKDIDFIRRAILNPKNEKMKSHLIQYLGLARPYYVPKNCVQTPVDISLRNCDLVGGIPYTSAKYSWPMDYRRNEYLQPILQVNLGKAGRLLRMNFGKDLLQVWGYCTEAYGYLRLELRIIPHGETKDVPSGFFPELYARSIEFDEKTNQNPKLLWKRAGSMFMGNFDFINSNDSETFWSLECDGLHLEDIPLSYPHQNLSVVLDEAYDVINSIRCLPYFGTYLGGYGGNMGSLGKFLSVDPDDGFLIIRLTSKEDDASVGVVANWAKEGQSFFTVECCYL